MNRATEQQSPPLFPILWTVVVFAAFTAPANSQEVIVLGSVDSVVEWLETEDWWGEEQHDEQLLVPHAMVTGISEGWRTAAQALPVEQKKEIFYRFMLPLVMHANELVLDRRTRLARMATSIRADQDLATEDMAWLKEIVVILRIMNEESAAGLGPPDGVLSSIDEALYRLDIIPAGLALGQAAYESGYATSRFAVEGNALFGQWTYGGDGLVPEQQRADLGDHRIASYEWPFDSVRGYFINLMSHPSYEDLRRIRAERRVAGEPLTSLALADGLLSYSERGQEYVDTLKGIIRVNGLEIADEASFRDEEIRFIVPADSDEDAAELREEIEGLRASGELASIVARMNLE